jgi:hypothetical protein
MQPPEQTEQQNRLGWLLQAERQGEQIEERYHRQGTAYRRARQLYAAGYAISATQYSVDEPPQPIAVYEFDGIRFVRVAKLS